MMSVQLTLQRWQAYRHSGCSCSAARPTPQFVAEQLLLRGPCDCLLLVQQASQRSETCRRSGHRCSAACTVVTSLHQICAGTLLMNALACAAGVATLGGLQAQWPQVQRSLRAAAALNSATETRPGILSSALAGLAARLKVRRSAVSRVQF